MKPVSFRKVAQVTAWLLLVLTAVDLRLPAFCALDQRRPPASDVSAARFDESHSPDNSTPPSPVHIDDCFCCSHCVNVTAIPPLEILTTVRLDLPLPADMVPVAAGYPPYHPPRA